MVEFQAGDARGDIVVAVARVAWATRSKSRDQARSLSRLGLVVERDPEPRSRPHHKAMITIITIAMAMIVQPAAFTIIYLPVGDARNTSEHRE